MPSALLAGASVITLSLLHPIKQIPVQVWTFGNESVIRIGRSTDNHVILYSAVVSRHHVELRRNGNLWELVNLGTNGTYLDGKRISQGAVSDGTVIRLARSGPNIKIRLGAEALEEVPMMLESVEGDRPFPLTAEQPPCPTEITEHRQEVLSQDDFETTCDGVASSASPGSVNAPPLGSIPGPTQTSAHSASDMALQADD